MYFLILISYMIIHIIESSQEEVMSFEALKNNCQTVNCQSDGNFILLSNGPLRCPKIKAK